MWPRRHLTEEHDPVLGRDPLDRQHADEIAALGQFAGDPLRIFRQRRGNARRRDGAIENVMDVLVLDGVVGRDVAAGSPNDEEGNLAGKFDEGFKNAGDRVRPLARLVRGALE